MAARNLASGDTFNIYLLYPIDRNDQANFYRHLQNYSNVGTEIFAFLLDWEKMEMISPKIPFPKCNLYVPADHEIFIHTAYLNTFLTEKQIDIIECSIIKRCDLFVSFGQYDSAEYPSMIKRFQYAEQQNMPIYTMPDLSPHSIEALKLAIKLIIRAGE